MKKRTMTVVLAVCMCVGMLTACGNNDAKTPETETVAEKTEAHEHAYKEAVTTAATCTEEGVKTYTCECGDTYTEAIPATGHSFTNYVYNEDATYEADGTETAKCDNCDETDTRTAEGTQLSYTYTDMDATKYAKSSVNVRNMPGTDGEKLGALSFNQEVKVTGQCNETGWYRIEYSGETAYVSDSYLVDNKVETAKNENKSSDNGGSGNDSSASGSSAEATSSECPYPLYTVIDEGGCEVYFYCLYDGVNSVGTRDGFWPVYEECERILKSRSTEPNYGSKKGTGFTGYYYDGLKVVRQTPIVNN